MTLWVNLGLFETFFTELNQIIINLINKLGNYFGWA